MSTVRPVTWSYTGSVTWAMISPGRSELMAVSSAAGITVPALTSQGLTGSPRGGRRGGVALGAVGELPLARLAIGRLHVGRGRLAGALPRRRGARGEGDGHGRGRGRPGL